MRTKMSIRGLVALLGLGLLLGGCMQATVEPASEANFTARDKKLLAAAPYAQATIPEPYKRHIVDYHRKEAPGTIVVDSDARYLFYVLPGGKAIRYGVAVGEAAMAWSGVAKIERKTEWPSWTPTPGERQRMDVPAFVSPGPQNPMGARAVSLRRHPRHAIPHSRHQSAGIYRPGDLLGLHPHDQRGRHRPLQSREDRH